nr:PREDICTED: kelch-like protein 9 isoform X1 [Lepisosteus oculatus]
MATHVGVRKCSLRSPEFPQTLHQGFRELWEAGCLCDIRLVAEDETFPAHRSVLAAASCYFRVMFTTDMKERNMDSVELKGISAGGLKCALDFIYTSQLVSDLESLEDALITSTHLQIPHMTACCAELLQSSLTADNFLEILSLSSRYDLASLKGECLAFISQNLDVILKTGESSLLQMDADGIWGLLRRDDVSPRVSETALLELVLKWVEYDLDRRQPYTELLLQEVRLGLIFPPGCGFEGDLGAAAELVKALPKGQAYLDMLSEQCLGLQTDSPVRNWFRIRSTRKAVLATCGKTTGSRECREVMILAGDRGQTSQTWRTIAHVEGMYNHCAVVLNDYLYIIGGQNSWFNTNHEEEATACVRRYDPRFDKWTRLADMHVRRRRFHCSALGDRIYAVGGRGEGGILSSSECYSPAEDKWTHIRALPCPLSSHAGAAYSNRLYVCGGSSGEIFSNAMYQYSPELDEWTPLPPLRYARGFHSMSPAGDKIYVMGGILISRAAGQARSYSDVLVTECYCPASRQWTELSPLPVGHSQHGAAALGSSIYIMGGFSWTEEGFLSSVHVYDREADAWRAGPQLPRPLVGVASGTLTLPHALRGKGDTTEPEPEPS